MKPLTVMRGAALLFSLFIIVGSSGYAAGVDAGKSASATEDAMRRHEEGLHNVQSKGHTAKLLVENGLFELSTLRGKTLDWAEFRNCVFRYVNARGASLRNVTFTNCVFERCQFADADFQGSIFEDSRISNSDFNRANFNGCHFTRTQLTESAFIEANLVSVVIAAGSSWQNCSLRNASLVPKRFWDSQIVNCDLSGGQLANGRLQNRLSGIFWDEGSAGNAEKAGDLSNTNLSGVNIAGVIIGLRPDVQLSWKDFALTQGLQDLVIRGNRAPFIALKAELLEKGSRKAARDLSCAIRRAERAELPADSMRWLDWLLFDVTCSYGSDFTTPAIGLLLSLIIGTIVSFVLSILWEKRNRKLSTYAFTAMEEPVESHPVPFYAPAPVAGGTRNWLERLSYSFLFSLCATTRFMGVGDVSVKHAILPLGTGFQDIDANDALMRIVAAIQAIVGLYLLILLVASYVWTPFS